jgi:hypothetical protein
VRRGEEDFVAVRTEERAGGLAHAWRDPLRIAGGEVEDVNLVERVAGLAFALEHQPLAVRRPIALAGALALDGEAADPRQEVALLACRRRLLRRDRGGGAEDEHQAGGRQNARKYRGTQGGTWHGAYYHRVILLASTQRRKFMKFPIPFLLATAIVLSVASLRAAAQTTPAAPASGGPGGNWELTINTPQDTTTVNLALTQEGETLTGTLSGRMGVVPVTGTAKADVVALEAKLAFQGASLQLAFDGRLEGEALNGTAKFGDFGEFPFTAKRAAAAADAPATAAAPPAAAAPADAATLAAGAAGRWNIVLSVPGIGDLPVTASLTQDPAGTIGGTLSSAAGDVEVAGTMRGATLTLDFKATTPQGDIPITMTGELNSAGLAGKASIVGIGEADWIATRVP